MACSNCSGCTDCCVDSGTGTDACPKLTTWNNEEIKPLACLAEYLDVCELPQLVSKLISNQWCINQNIIKNICEMWDILVDNGYVTITKTYSYTVPVEKFIRVSDAAKLGVWFSGSPEVGECYITIPIDDMDIVDTVIPSAKVVPNRTHPVTVAVQDAARISDTEYRVNFDTYEIEGLQLQSAPETLAPFAVTIEFVVVGRKLI